MLRAARPAVIGARPWRDGGELRAAAGPPLRMGSGAPRVPR